MATLLIEVPLPGVVFLAPSPGMPLFKSVGDAVVIGDTLALVEVMKSYVPVEAEAAGIFKGYIATNEAVLEPGDPLCELEV